MPTSGLNTHMSITVCAHYTNIISKILKFMQNKGQLMIAPLKKYFDLYFAKLTQNKRFNNNTSPKWQ